MTALYDFLLRKPEIEYNEINKAMFKKLGQSFLKKLVRYIKLDFEVLDSKVSWNPGGIAVSGDHNLMLMFSEGRGVYLTISSGAFGHDGFMARSITHMKDYTGGNNQWFDRSKLRDFPEMNEILKRFR